MTEMDNRLFQASEDSSTAHSKPVSQGIAKRRFCEAVAQAGLTLHELYPFGQDYVRTLACWSERFEAQLEKVKAMG